LSLYDLMFELSNEDRHRILLHLLSKEAKLTELSKALSLPVQEVSRQLSRMENVDLVRKSPKGSYGVTPYASHVLGLIPGLGFLSEHREYFMSHTLSGLPRQFVDRIGSLTGASYIGDVMMAFSNVETAIREAQESIWILSDQILMSTLPLIQEAEERGVEFRLMLPESVEPPPVFFERMTRMMEAPPPKPGQMETRWLEAVSLTMTLNERRVSHISFRGTDGGHDYRGFKAEDPNSLVWARDLFQHLWEKASKGIPEHLLSQ
jgi:predicted transcriptional regulator